MKGTQTALLNAGGVETYDRKNQDVGSWMASAMRNMDTPGRTCAVAERSDRRKTHAQCGSPRLRERVLSWPCGPLSSQVVRGPGICEAQHAASERFRDGVLRPGAGFAEVRTEQLSAGGHECRTPARVS